MTSLELTDDGRVRLVPDEGDIETLGHVADDHLCPYGMEDEWAALFDRWAEETAEGRAELSLLMQEYYSLVGGLR